MNGSRLIRHRIESSTEVEPDLAIVLGPEQSAIERRSVDLAGQVRIRAEVFRGVVQTNGIVRIEGTLLVLFEEPTLLVRAIARSGDHRPRPGQNAFLAQAFVGRDISESIRIAIGEHRPLLLGIRRLAGARGFNLSIAQDQTPFEGLELHDDEGRVAVARVANAIFVHVGLIRIRHVGAIVHIIGNGVRVGIGS